MGKSEESLYIVIYRPRPDLSERLDMNALYPCEHGWTADTIGKRSYLKPLPLSEAIHLAISHPLHNGLQFNYMPAQICPVHWDDDCKIQLSEEVAAGGDAKIKLHWNEDGTALYPVELDIGDGFIWYVTSKKPKGGTE